MKKTFVALLFCAHLGIHFSASAQSDAPNTKTEPIGQSLPRQQDYAYHWSITGGANNSAQRIVLTTDVYAALANKDLTDIAVFDANGKSMPLSKLADDMVPQAITTTHAVKLNGPWIVGAAESETSNAISTQRSGNGEVSASIHSDGSVNVQLRAPSTRFEFDNPSDTYELDLALPQQTDGAMLSSLKIYWRGRAQGDWLLYRPRNSEQADLLVSRAIAVAPNERGLEHLSTIEIGNHYPKNLYLIARDIEANFKIDRIEAIVESASDFTQIQFTKAKLIRHQENEKSRHEWLFESAGPLPIERVILDLPSGSAAQLQVSHMPREATSGWHHYAYTAFDLANGNNQLADNGIIISNTRDQIWQVTSDSPNIDGAILKLGFKPEQFIFLQQGQAPFTLAAGLYGAKRNEFPARDVLQRLRIANADSSWLPNKVELGLRQTGRGDEATRTPPPDQSEKYRQWLLWAVLALGAIVISLVAIKLLGSPAKSVEAE